MPKQAPELDVNAFEKPFQEIEGVRRRHRGAEVGSFGFIWINQPDWPADKLKFEALPFTSAQIFLVSRGSFHVIYAIKYFKGAFRIV